MATEGDREISLGREFQNFDAMTKKAPSKDAK